MEPVQPRQPTSEEHLAGLIRAIRPADLELRFQPILLVSAPGRFALELLLRFRPPELAALGTEAVFRRAHALGVAHQLDALVLAQLQGVQQNLRRLGELGGLISYVAVNISGASVATEARLEQLLALLRGHRVDPALFRLEITETAAMELLEGDGSLVSSCQRLMDELNFRLLVDDFGSGLSNYRRLCDVWYDSIKLDLQLVRGIARSFRLQGFVGSLIEAVHGIGRTVVAEGVENHRDLEVVLRLGADAVQGFLISRPLRWEQLEPFLRQTDIAVCLLPLTPETEGIFCKRTFDMMPRGSMLVNVGRGGHVVVKDLIAALDSGQLAYAALDALRPEPLPPESPLWDHPKVTVMPHVARRPTVGQLAGEIVANIRAIKAGGRPFQEVNKGLGY